MTLSVSGNDFFSCSENKSKSCFSIGNLLFKIFCFICCNFYIIWFSPLTSDEGFLDNHSSHSGFVNTASAQTMASVLFLKSLFLNVFWTLKYLWWNTEQSFHLWNLLCVQATWIESFCLFLFHISVMFHYKERGQRLINCALWSCCLCWLPIWAFNGDIRKLAFSFEDQWLTEVLTSIWRWWLL